MHDDGMIDLLVTTHSDDRYGPEILLHNAYRSSTRGSGQDDGYCEWFDVNLHTFLMKL